MEVIGKFFGNLICGIFTGIGNFIGFIFGKGVAPLSKGLFNGLPWWGKLIIILLIVSLLINILGPIFRFVKGTYKNAKDIVGKVKNKSTSEDIKDVESNEEGKKQ